MKLAFVRPSFGVSGAGRYRSWALLEPLVFAHLAALTPRAWEVELFDERIVKVPVGRRFDLAVISADTWSARRAYDLAAAFRAAGTPTLLGGLHPTLLPEEAAIHAEHLALGEVEGVWPAVVEDLRAGALEARYTAPAGGALSIAVDRSVYGRRRYLPLGLVATSRGCVNRCEFCSIHTFYGDTQRRRPLGEVVEEVERLWPRPVFFVDDNLTADREAAHALCTALEGRRVRWFTQAGLDVANDPELLDHLAASGCFGLMVGLESLEARNLAQMKKGWAGRLSYPWALDQLRRRGLWVYGAFLFGYDHDTEASVEAAAEFALRERLFLVNMNPVQPYPGTALLQRLEQEGRLTHPRWWLEPGYTWGQLAFEPRGVEAARLEAALGRARLRLHSVGGIAARGSHPLHWITNLVSAADVRAKTGLHLGDLP